MPVVVSIVIPTHDRPALLRRAIISALNQTVRDIEVIVVDDGSDPPVALAGRDSRVRLIRNAQSVGVCAARNVGLEAAVGDYVTFLDDDDELAPLMVAENLNVIQGSRLPAPIAAMGAVEVRDPNDQLVSRHVNPPSPKGRPYHLALADDLGSGAVSTAAYNALLMPTQLLKEIGGFDPNLRSWEHDDLILRLNAVCSIESLDDLSVVKHDHRGVRRHQDHLDVARAIEATWIKHRRLLRGYPQKEAKYLSTAGTAYLQAGKWGDAVRMTSRGLRTRPNRHTAERFAAAVLGPHLSRGLAAVRRLWRDRVPRRGT